MYELRAPDKLRPVVVLSRAEAIEVLHTVMVAPITSTIRSLPSEVVVGEDEGLKRASAVNLDHVQTVEKASLRRFVGTLKPSAMRRVCAALSVALGCDEA